MLTCGGLYTVIYTSLLRICLCNPADDQMVTVCFGWRRLESLKTQYDFTLVNRFGPKILISFALFTAAHFHMPKSPGTLKQQCRSNSLNTLNALDVQPFSHLQMCTELLSVTYFMTLGIG